MTEERTLFRLDERVALVTGGSRGIGRSVAQALARAGAHVVVNYRSNEDAARQCVDSIQAAGGQGEMKRFDIADHEEVDAAIAELHGRLGRLDILVNNAGIAVDQLLLRLKPEALTQTLTTNLAGGFWCTKSAVRLMIRAKYGRIINVSSVVGETGNIGQSAYAASKAGLIGLTKSVAREYASRGLTVNAVSPGYIETDMTAELPKAALEAMVNATPLGRVGRPEEVAAAVLFLASEEAGYITGQVLRVNGGMYM